VIHNKYIVYHQALTDSELAGQKIWTVRVDVGEKPGAEHTLYATGSIT
jgi:hypothetical protein